MNALKLTLALLLAAAAPAAADPRARNFAGVWKGPVTSTPNNCVWQVTASVLEKNAYANGTFNYSGPCGRGLQSGTFSARPTGPNCYDVSAGVPGMPKLQFAACFKSNGDVELDSMLLKGSVRLSEENRKAEFSAQSMLGGAAGTLRKTMTPPPGKGPKKKAPAPVKPPSLQKAGAD